MLQQMRSFSRSWFATALMTGLALSFVIWGIGPTFTAGNSTWVAKVGGRCRLVVFVCDTSATVDRSVLQREYQNDQRRAANSKLTPEQIKKYVTPQRTLDRMVGDIAMSNYTSSYGLSVSDAEVSNQIHHIPGFTGLAGTFDKATYLQRIGELGYTDADFTQVVRNDLVTAQMRSAVEDGFLAPSGYVAAIANFISQARSADYVILTPGKLAPIAPPGDTVLAAYVKSHVSRYSTPEYRSLTYAAIGPEDVQSKINVTDKQLHSEYDQRSAEFNTPESREVDQISFLTAAEAAAARARIKADADYDALAKARKLTTKTLSLGTVTREQIAEKDRADAIFSTPIGQVSQPVKGPFGYVLVRVRKITPAVSKPFDTVRADIEKALRTKIAGSMIDDIANRFKEQMDSGFEIDEAAKKAGMHLVTVPAVDSKGLAPDGSKANVGRPEFMQQVFAAEIGEDGDTFATGDGHNYAVKVTGSVPPKPRSFDSVRTAALADWMRDAQVGAMQRKATALADQANKDGSLVGVASTLGTTVAASGRLEHDPSQGLLPAYVSLDKSDVFSPGVLRSLFARPAGVAIAGPLAKGEGYVIVRTTGVTHVKINMGDPNYRQILVGLSQMMGGDLSSGLANAEKSRQGVRVDQKMLDQVAGGETG